MPKDSERMMTPAAVPPTPVPEALPQADVPADGEPKAAAPDDAPPTCHYCGCPMVQHTGGLKDGCWHAEGGCCFLPGRRALRPGHPPCDTYAAAHPDPTP